MAADLVRVGGPAAPTRHHPGVRWLLATAWLLVLASLTACGSSPGGAASATPPSSPSVSRDAQVTVHLFARQGFSLAYAGDWVAQFPDGRGWYAKDPPPGQAARWSMLLVGHPDTSEAAGRPVIVVSVRRDRTAVDPAAFQRDVARLLETESPSEVFRPATVDGIPALMAAFRDSNATPATEEERYVFGESGIVYDFELRAPVAVWATEAPVMRGILQSFTLPGG